MQHTIDLASLREAIAYYASWIEFRQRYLRLPGVQVAVFAHGEPALTRAFGYANLEEQIPLTDRHLFRIGSQSKTLTTIMLLRLVEQQSLRLDDTVAHRLPQLTNTRVGQVNIRELLGHSAGLIRDAQDADSWQLWYPFPDHQQLLATAEQASTAVLARSERFKYSNHGYGLLGLIIEAITGRGYADEFDRAITHPLRLSATGPDLDRTRIDEYATGYTALSYADRRVAIDHVPTRALAPACGAYATARDLARIFAALLPGDDTLLGDTLKRQMRSPRWSTRGMQYGLGLMAWELDHRTILGHSGLFPGHNTASLLDPDTDTAVSILTNSVDWQAEALAFELPHIISLATSTRRPDKAEDLDHFAGRFASLLQVTDIAVLGGRLYMVDPTHTDPTTEAIPLEVVDHSTLRIQTGSGSPSEPLRYSFSQDGSVRSIRGPLSHTMVPLAKLQLPHRVRMGWGPPTD